MRSIREYEETHLKETQRLQKERLDLAQQVGAPRASSPPPPWAAPQAGAASSPQRPRWHTLLFMEEARRFL